MEHGKRHPTLMDNVVLGAGAKVLGTDSTVVGIPGGVIHQ